MLQCSINEKYLRYYDTKLYLTECIDKSKIFDSMHSNNSSLTEEEIFK